MAALIAARRAEDGIPYAVSCRALGVSRSWFYKWNDGRLPPRAARRQRLKAEVARLFGLHEGKYGSPRITADLRDAGWRVSENTVAALMREQGLVARRKTRRGAPPGRGRAAGGRRTWSDGTSPRRRSTRSGTATGPRSPPARASCTSPRCWTWPRAGCSGSRWASITTPQLAYGALAMAVAVRGGQAPGVIFHTDQGSEYTAGAFRGGLPAAGHQPVHGQARLGAGQRGHRVLALDPGVRAALPGALRHQGRRPGPGSPPGSRSTTRTRRHSSLGMRQPGGLRAGAAGRGGGLRCPRFSAAQDRPVLGPVQVVPPRA